MALELEIDFPLFQRVAPEANITGGNPGQLLTGWINSSYTTNLTAYYEPSTLPAPFPLVIVSSLVSFILACIGWKTAAKTWTSPGRRYRMDPKIKALPYRQRLRMNWAAYKSGAKNPPGLTVEEVPLQSVADHLPRQIQEDGGDDLGELRGPVQHAHLASKERGQGREMIGVEDEEEGGHEEWERDFRAKEQQRQHGDSAGGGDGMEFDEYGRFVGTKEQRDDHVHAALEEGAIDSIPRSDLPPIMRLPESSGPSYEDPTDVSYLKPRTRVMVRVAAAVTLLRAIIAFGTEVAVAATHGTHAAPSSLFLLLLSLQTFISNRILPTGVTLLMVFFSALIAAAFMMSIWDWSGDRYAQLFVEGGRCPVYASDCFSQAHQWENLGCGSTLTFEPIPGHSSYNNPNWGDKFYPPYGTQGNINSGVGVLYIIEAFVGGCGTFWAVPTVLATLWEASKVVRGLYSWSELLRPMPERFLVAPPPPGLDPTGKRKWRRLGWSAVVGIIALFGIFGAFVTTVLSIAGHTAAETIEHHATFIDSFGPPVPTNFTVDGHGYMNATFYGGNATSWSDCFNVPTPVSSNGFFAQWLAHNEHVLFRLISLV